MLMTKTYTLHKYRKERTNVLYENLRRLKHEPLGLQCVYI